MNDLIKYKQGAIQKVEHKRCYITLFDYFYWRNIKKYFSCLRLGTIESRTKDFADITLKLNPPFIFDKSFNNLKQKREFILRKSARLFCPDFASTCTRNINRRLNNEKYLCEMVKGQVKLFDLYIKKQIETNPYFKKFKVWDLTEEKDYLEGKYCAALTRQVIYFDTCEFSKRCYITEVLDACSRKNVIRIVTESPPSAIILQKHFSLFLTDDIKKRLKLIHCDRCGCNTDTDFKHFFYLLAIRLSYGIKKHTNQVCESVNSRLKTFRDQHTFEGMDSDVKFQDMGTDMQFKMAYFCIDTYNDSIIYPNRKYIFHYSRNTLDAAMEYIQSFAPEKFSNTFILVTNKSQTNTLINMWKNMVVKIYLLSIKQVEFSKKFGILILFINKALILKACECLENNFLNLKTMKDEINENEDFYALVEQKSSELYERGYFKQQIFDSLKILLQKRYAQCKTQEDKDIIAEKMGWLALEQAKDVEQQEQNQEILRQFNLVNQKLELVTQDRDNLSKAVEKLTEKITAMQEKQNHKIVRRNQNRSLQSRASYSVMPQDFVYVLKIIAVGKDMFIISKYAVAHAFLKATGMRIGNLIYLNYEQLDNFYNRKTVCIRLIKHPYIKYMKFPYVPQIKKYLDPTRVYYQYLKSVQYTHPSLFEIDKNSEHEEERERSEIYGYLNRSSFSRYFNGQLKKAGMLLKPRKKLTSHGYRRGVAIICTLTSGILATRDLLGHAKISSTEAYIEHITNEKRMRETLKSVHSVNDSKRGIYKNFTPEEEESFVAEIEENLD